MENCEIDASIECVEHVCSLTFKLTLNYIQFISFGKWSSYKSYMSENSISSANENFKSFEVLHAPMILTRFTTNLPPRRTSLNFHSGCSKSFSFFFPNYRMQKLPQYCTEFNINENMMKSCCHIDPFNLKKVSNVLQFHAARVSSHFCHCQRPSHKN